MQAFISYSFHDKEIKNKLKKSLESSGIQCYDAVHDEDYGNSISDKLSRAIDNNDLLIAILTHNGSSSTSVSGEIAYAKKAGKRIIPLVMEGVTVPIFLQGTEQIRFTSNNLDDTCKKIVRFVATKFSQSNNDNVAKDNSTEETIVIKSGEYEAYAYELEDGDTLVGQINSGIPVNVFIVNDRNLSLLDKEKDFTAEYDAERVKRCKINFQPSKPGSWNVVIINEEEDNEEYEDVEVDVFLDVR